MSPRLLYVLATDKQSERDYDDGIAALKSLPHGGPGRIGYATVCTGVWVKVAR